MEENHRYATRARPRLLRNRPRHCMEHRGARVASTSRVSQHAPAAPLQRIAPGSEITVSTSRVPVTPSLWANWGHPSPSPIIITHHLVLAPIPRLRQESQSHARQSIGSPDRASSTGLRGRGTSFGERWVARSRPGREGRGQFFTFTLPMQSSGGALQSFPSPPSSPWRTKSRRARVSRYCIGQLLSL